MRNIILLTLSFLSLTADFAFAQGNSGDAKARVNAIDADRVARDAATNYLLLDELRDQKFSELSQAPSDQGLTNIEIPEIKDNVGSNIGKGWLILGWSILDMVGKRYPDQYDKLSYRTYWAINGR